MEVLSFGGTGGKETEKYIVFEGLVLKNQQYKVATRFRLAKLKKKKRLKGNTERALNLLVISVVKELGIR